MSPRLANTSERRELDRRWRPALMAFFLRRVKNHSEAEDLTQEVFTRMLKEWGNDAHPDGYVFQIAANLLIDRGRKSRVRERYREGIAVDETHGIDFLDPHSFAEARDQLIKLIAALDELPERTRTMFILFRIENMSQDVIGASFGVSASAVKQQIAKAMAHVAKRMRGAW